ncbi:NLR family CARD domain-containing protein 4-like [Erpetoichthys calabaricus]|uniref:NLR family CARD domain-containing protein 4 n=1 Tax=Erpetoichthys calabaricus TaxID=27687 RepID=A0A8C4SQW7_ERPCA|nr:NLR family CARD domain-containing protein 4-like [Erpetoichthys calabaricus]
MDFIKKNYEALVQRMGQTTITQIVDYCYSQDILDSEESEAILCNKQEQKAARMMITMIRKKGAAACDAFVASLEKHNRYLYEDLQDNCLPQQMTQRDIEKMAEDLKAFYVSATFRRFHPLGKDIDIIFDLNTTFTDAELWEKDLSNRRRKCLSFTKLLDEFKSPTIIEGDAGKGKTTLLKRIAVLWASGECTPLRKFKLVFFIQLSTSTENIYETVCRQLLGMHSDIGKKAFTKAISELKREVLFLLDSYDEFKPSNCPELNSLIKENAHFKNMVVLTTRTESISRVRQYGETITEIGDFTVENATLLVRNVLEPELSNTLLLELHASSTMKELMKTPLFVVITCAIRMGETSFIPKTQTALFCTLYDLMIEKNNYKMHGTSNHMISESIERCKQLALDGIFQEEFKFTLDDLLSEHHVQVLLDTGLLNKYSAHVLKPIYRFFHKTFQEYVAGRKLTELLTSAVNEEVNQGLKYLNRIDNISDITNKYHKLLLYICGSSQYAAGIVIKHMAGIHTHGRLLGVSSGTNGQNIVLDDEQGESLQNLGELQKLQEASMNAFVGCALSFFSESLSKSSLSTEFKIFFQDKTLYINSMKISESLFDFFKYLPSCLTALGLIQLDLFPVRQGNESLNQNRPKTFIPNKAVSLFFDWTNTLSTIEVSLKDFQQLSRKDVTYLAKICCSASSVRLHISNSDGIKGKLRDILEACEQNMEDLIIEDTPLTLSDEQQICSMKHLKTLYISYLEAEQLQGGLFECIQNLEKVHNLTLDNVKMTYTDAEKIGQGLRHLNQLRLLHLSRVTEIGDGFSFVFDAITHQVSPLEKLEIVNCCLTKEAFMILVENLQNIPQLKVLDCSKTSLGQESSDCIGQLAEKLNELQKLKILMLPWGSDINKILMKLLTSLEQKTGLKKLGFQKWFLTDVHICHLASIIEKGHLQDIEHLDLEDNCVTSEGWKEILTSIGRLKNLKYINLSSNASFTPSPWVINMLSKQISELRALQEILILNWQLDEHDMENLHKVRSKGGREFRLRVNTEMKEEDEEEGS